MRSVVVEHRSPLFADVLARALVLSGLQARTGDASHADDDEVLVTDRPTSPGGLALTESVSRQPVSVLLDLLAAAPSRGARRRTAAPADASLASLTPREGEVLVLLAGGATNDGIADELGISRHTARTHVQNLLAKLGVDSRLGASALARRRGLVPTASR